MKSSHRIKATIEPEHVFVEVGLQVFGFNTAMMSPFNPSFQIAKNKMNHGQVRLSLVRVAAKRQCLMAITAFGKARVSCPAIGAQRGTKRDVVFDKAGKRIGAAIGHDTKPQAPRIGSASELLAIFFTGPNLDSANDDGLVMRAATFTARLAADHAFIDLDRMLAADGVTLGANHASAELVEYLKCCLITRERKLSLELDSGLSGDLSGHQVRAPKPRRERRMARLHHGTSRERRIGFASTAAQHYRRTRSETIRLSYKPALRTRKPIWPTDGFKVASASRVIGENPLKLGKRSGEASNVHGRDNGISLRLCQATG